MAAPRSCGSRAKSWSDGLAAASLPILVGPTAVGKTAVALALAAYWPLEVISADSRQIYRRLDIGTAKPTRRERLRVPHHGVDLVEPGERYSAGRFARDASGWIDAVRSQGKLPVVVGGTGLYIRALVEGLFHEPAMDPARRRAVEHWAATLPTEELVRWVTRLDAGFAGGGRQRAIRALEVVLLTGRPLSHWQRYARAQRSFHPWYVRLTAPRPVLHRRIEVRAEEMVRRGVIEEVAAVLAEGHASHAPGLDGVGIKEAVEYLHGTRPRDTVAEAITVATRQYAKRQETWFRHQLDGPVLSLDATRPPEQLAQIIARAWTAFQEGGAVPNITPAPAGERP
jgi:tRNA dimethylallyltransferase